jgi:hypothetical protein
MKRLFCAEHGISFSNKEGWYKEKNCGEDYGEIVKEGLKGG